MWSRTREARWSGAECQWAGPGQAYTECPRRPPRLRPPHQPPRPSAGPRLPPPPRLPPRPASRPRPRPRPPPGRAAARTAAAHPPSMPAPPAGSAGSPHRPLPAMGRRPAAAPKASELLIEDCDNFDDDFGGDELNASVGFGTSIRKTPAEALKVHARVGGGAVLCVRAVCA